MLDDAGFPNAAICASGDLDENLIRDLKLQGACIDTWGVGTKLITSEDCPSLGGVYKLAAEYEPIYLLLTMCDREPAREEEAMAYLERHIRQFQRIYQSAKEESK